MFLKLYKRTQNLIIKVKLTFLNLKFIYMIIRLFYFELKIN